MPQSSTGLFAQAAGTLVSFDRMVFKGLLQSLVTPEGMKAFLSHEGVLLKDFKSYSEKATAALETTAKSTAESAGRPYLYLQKAHTARSDESKEQIVRDLAAKDGVTEGLVCVLAVQETCQTMKVKRVAPSRLGFVRSWTKCNFFYYYFIDPDFGQMHVRIQSWFPFEIQVYVNGHEWLTRQLRKLGCEVETYDNCLTKVGDLPLAQKLAEKLSHKDWPAFLNEFAERVNPWLAHIRANGFRDYWWVIRQLEISTDVLFPTRKTIEEIAPDLYDYAIRAFGAENVMRFLGRLKPGAFRGDLTTDLKRRPEGWRIKHWMNGNSIKMYDKWSVIRIETTISNPREFKTLKHVEVNGKPSWRWLPMTKGVANMWRYFQVGLGANGRYLEDLYNAAPKGKAVKELDGLCHSKTSHGRRIPRLEPVSAFTAALFAAIMSGEHAMGDFRNKHIVQRLYRRPARSARTRKRRCARISRHIAKLRGHGLVARIPKTHRYRVTKRGARLMGAVMMVRGQHFPAAAAK